MNRVVIYASTSIVGSALVLALIIVSINIIIILSKTHSSIGLSKII